MMKSVTNRPHLVILGAGASIAAFPHGDKNGKKLPDMDNFIEVLGLQELNEFIDSNDNNFESIYSSLYKEKKYKLLLEGVEKKIRNYFSKLELPENPTLYDHLILSLRKKDVIASFNWDPFLFNAACRVQNYITRDIPRLAFLHGNVAIKLDHENKKMIHIDEVNPNASASPLLYPIENKNYTEYPSIDAHWKFIRKVLEVAFIVTIFGYGAPESDRGAIDLLHAAWGNSNAREFEEIEFIDIKPKNELAAKWDKFIHTNHYRVSQNFYDSLIGKFPRRSCGELQREVLGAEAIDYDTKIPWSNDWDKLQEWFHSLS